MGARIRAFDWTHTPLGPIELWPQSLKSSVSLILGSRHPMWIGWGRQMTFLYNDAYLHVLGPAKHPSALGRPAAEVWAEIWHVCGPLADKVFENGEASFVDDVRLFMNRGEFLEETFYSFSYSPIWDEFGRVSGLFCPSTDVTPKVVNARRLKTLSELASQALVEKTIAGACLVISRTLAKNPDDIPFALLYLADSSGKLAHLEQMVGSLPAVVLGDGVVDLTGSPESSPWRIAEAYSGMERRIVPMDDVPGLPCGVANQPVKQAVVLPVTSPSEQKAYGVLVAGVNPGRPLDAEHLTFFDLLARQVAAAIQNAKANEEEKKRAEMLAEIDRAKTLFFSNVSHEFRTPLTLTLGPLERLLAAPERLPAASTEELSVAHRNSLRLLKLVNSLLDFSRIEAGRVQARFVPTDLARLTSELASSFRSAMEAAGLDFVVDCPRLPEPVYVDVEMWEKIVLNLLSNAFKFTFEGRVSVRLSRSSGHAVLKVSDTGTGIPEPELPRLFERFHRIEGARGRSYEGTGIGLALIQELVKLHGGEISVSSRFGAGSTFTVTVPFGTLHLPQECVESAPAAQAPGTAQQQAFLAEAENWVLRNGHRSAPAIAESESQAAAKPRILVVDDNSDMREHIARILGEDYEIWTAEDGEQALELVSRRQPDLVLTDVMMPKMDGFELLRSLRASADAGTIPVIFVSARAGEETQVEGLEAGADDYLVKPFTANELRARVGTHVQMSVARRRAAEQQESVRTREREIEGRFRDMIDALPAAIYTTDAEGRLTHFNPAAVKLSGRVPQLGTDQWCVTWKLFLPDGTPLPHEQCPMAVALKEGRVVSGAECIAERPDGSRFWFTPYPTPLRDSAGRITGAINMLVDITGRKTADETLRRSEERFRAILDATPECVKLVAPDGTLLHMNSSGLAMIGAESLDEVIGKSIYDLIAPEYRDAWRAFNQKVCGGEKASVEFEITGLDGQRRRMETHAVPLRNPDGTLVQLAITRDISERQRSESAALLLGAIVDSSDDAIVSKNLNGIVTSWNRGAERLFGYTAQEVVGKSITIIIPPDRLGEEPEILRRLQRGERVDHFETIRRRKDGALLNISLTISPVRDKDGKVIGASKIARDITDRKLAEAAIQELNAQLTLELAAMTRMQQLSTRLVQAEEFPVLLGEIIDAGIEITRADMGNIQLFEDGALKIVVHRGFDAAFLDFFETVFEGSGACGTALRSGERIIIEDVTQSPIFAGSPALEVLRAAGVRAVQSTPLISRSGERLGIFSTHYGTAQRPGARELRMLDLLARQAADLIERKRAESALLASEGRFRQLADSMPQIVWTARPDGYLDYFNERWYEFTGFGRDRFGDTSWQPILHPDDAQSVHESWYDCVSSGEPFRIECRFWDRHERRWRWFMGRALPVRDQGGNIVKWFGTCTDIDEQKRVETELRQANADLEQFAYSASHDLQEPLRGIKIYSQLLTSRYSNRLDGQALEFLEFLRGSASRMEMLVRDLLAYTQVTKIDAPDSDTDANEALRYTLANLGGAIVESQACITSDALPSVRVHDAHLKQLFQNLVGNAIKYRSPDRAPTVHVSAKRLDGYWLFSVADNGIGIEPEYKERIFGLFKRLHSGDEYSGTGIGLAICQRIVDRYHGRIWVESTPGQGSNFQFTLPV